MKKSLQLISFICLMLTVSIQWSFAQTMVQVNASDPNIQYIGRVNNSNPNSVVFAFPGVSIKAKFQGTRIDALLVEGGTGGTATTNYFNVIIDGGTPTVLKLNVGQTLYTLASGLTDATHTVELFKRTETSVGKVTFNGFQVVSGKTLVAPDPLPTRKIMFIGNSITCGYGNESSNTTPASGFTSVNENNYKAWGAVTARNLNAQYHSISFSGRGLFRNNSGSQVGTAPTFFDQTIADDASLTWDHSKFVPDVVVINLGTNDFAAEVSSAAYTVDQTTFTNTYLNFITKIRTVYPNAKIFCTVGVMMSDYYPSGGLHWTRIQNYVQSVVTTKNNAGDANVFYYMMDPQSPPYGEDWHPTAATDAVMATGMTNFINSKVTWVSCPGSVSLGNDINVNTATFPVTLNSNSVARTGVTYKWYKDGTLISGATSPTYQVTSSAGAAAVYKVVRDSATCTWQDQMEMNTVLVPVGHVAKWDYNKKAAVVLTFDDWSAGHPAIVVPELKSRNMIATFSIVPSLIYNSTMWASINSAVADGNEISNHTRTHVYCNSASLYASDGAAAKTTIETNVPSQKVSTFIYPFGSYDDALIGYLKTDGYVGARGVYPSSGNYTYNFAPTINDYYKILTYSMDNTITTSAFNTQVQNIISGGGLLTFLYHSVNSATVVDNNYATLPQSALQAQLDVLVTNKNSIWVTTFSAALKYHREASCATLGEVQAPNGVQWVVKLTDTLSNNALFNQPLYVQLKMNGVNYDQVTQNGLPLTIEYKANDSIMFHAVPDGGNIILKTSSGIALTAAVTPSQISNASTSITFSATATPTVPNTISQVALNLTALGGGSAVAMTAKGGNAYEYIYTVPAGLSLGDKSIDVTATDNAAHTQTSTVVVTVGSGINIVSSSVSPSSVVNNISNALTFSLNATDDGSVASVKLDLSSIGGGTAVAMTSAGSNNYTLSYTLAPTAISGTKSIIATVTDNLGNTKTATISITINPSITYLDIYTDASSMINGFWVGGGTDTFLEQSNAGAIEGVKDYKYTYTITSYWAGMGMSLTNFNDALAKDFSTYDSIQISYKGPITNGTGFNLSLIGLANVKSTSVSLPASATYTTAKIALSAFGTFDLTKITQLTIDITGTPSGPGSIQIDNIRLFKAAAVPTTVAVTSITFTPAASTTMTVGGTQTITAVIAPTNATDKSVTWNTSDATIAAVSSGVVTALKAGTVTITCASVQNPTVTQTITIVISNILPSSIAITPTGAQSVNVGGTLALTATISPSNAADKTVIWTSSNTSVATVDASGLVTGVSAGTATITATSNAVSSVKATSSVTVSNIAVTSITFSPAALTTMTVGGTQTITAVIAPSNATDKSVTWNTSDATIATVSSGVVTALKAGTVTITCASVQNPTVTQTVTIVISNILPSSIAITPTGAQSVSVGGTLALTATISPSNAADKTVIWTSSNTSVATVDASGLVTGVSAGTATITATSNAVSSVKATSSVTVSNIAVSTITFTPAASTTMTVGGTQTITAVIAPTNATDKSVTWNTSDATIATVSSGVVTALKAGTVTITCASVQNPTVTQTVTIVISNILPSSIAITPTGAQSVNVGGTLALTATISPSNAADKTVIWTSSNTSVATVDASGLVTGLSAGTATITATSNAVSSVKATSSVTVSNIAVSTITFTPAASTTMTVGGTQTITAVIAPSNATDKSVTWNTSDATIATVSSGVVTALKAGTVTITCASVQNPTVTQTVTIIISNILPSSIAITPTGAQSVSVGGTLALTATISPSNAADKTVIWTSSNTSVATVDASGLVTGVSAGTATITATSNAVSSVKATSSVTVSNVLVSGIVVTPSIATMIIGQVTQLSATVSPLNATLKTYTWTSSDASKVTVQANGTIKAIAEGSATITATANDGSGIIGNCVVIVNPVLPVSIAANDISMLISQTSGQLITYTVNTDSTTNKAVTFVSADPSIASVDASGLLIPIGLGTTTVTITSSALASVTKVITITITASVIEITGVTVDYPTVTLAPGETKTILATISPVNASNTTVSWSSDNSGIASVDGNGVITAIVPGTATITVTVTTPGMTKTTTVSVTVQTVQVTSVFLNAAALNLNLLSTPITLLATVNPANATNNAITWSSSNTSVATVVNGVVSVQGIGTATITVTTVDGSKTATCLVTVNPISVTSVSLDQTTLTLTEASSTVELIATINPITATNKSVTWNSSNTSVATVVNGVVSVQGIGTATITVTTVDGSKTATCLVTVNPISVTSVSLDQTTLSLTQTSSPVVLVAAINPTTATNKSVTWNSSNTSVATVVNGVVSVQGIGTATITVTTVDGSKTATCLVTVNSIPVVSVSLDQSSLSLTTSSSPVALVATVLPAAATNKAVNWSSSNTAVATVVNGVVVAQGIGTATITVTTVDGSKIASCSVTVNAIPVTSVSLDQTSIQLIPTSSPVALVATVLPAAATNKTVNWSSSNTAVATVINGVVIAQGVGTTTITVTTVDGSKTATCVVTINAIPVTSVSLNQSSLSLTTSSSPAALVATLLPATATNKAVNWSSSNTAVATVVNGVVSAQGVGTATITVTTVDGSKIATCLVTVSSLDVLIQSITLDGNVAVINKGNSSTVTVTFGPINTTQTNLNIEAGNSGIVSVSKLDDTHYSITGLTGGIQQVTFRSATNSSIYQTITVTVTELVESIAINPVGSISSVNVNQTLQLQAVVSQPTASNKNVTWLSLDESIATVSSTGLVTGVSAGFVVVKATANDGSLVKDEILIQVTSVPVTSIDANIVSTIDAGNTAQVTYTLYPQNATNKNVTFTSSNEAVASVDANGLVTGLTQGQTVITISSVSNPSIIQTVTLTVVQVVNKDYLIDLIENVTYGAYAVNMKIQNGEIVIGNSAGQVPQLTYNSFLDAWQNAQDVQFDANATQLVVDAASNELSVAIQAMGIVIPPNSIDNTSELTVSVYPTKISDFVTVEAQGIQVIQVISNTGKILDIIQGNGSENVTINTSNFVQGIYFIEVITNEGTVVRNVIK